MPELILRSYNREVKGDGDRWGFFLRDLFVDLMFAHDFVHSENFNRKSFVLKDFSVYFKVFTHLRRGF